MYSLYLWRFTAFHYYCCVLLLNVNNKTTAFWMTCSMNFSFCFSLFSCVVTYRQWNCSLLNFEPCVFIRASLSVIAFTLFMFLWGQDTYIMWCQKSLVILWPTLCSCKYWPKKREAWLYLNEKGGALNLQLCRVTSSSGILSSVFAVGHKNPQTLGEQVKNLFSSDSHKTHMGFISQIL